jgi:membrane-associated phospholipid phosphatase
MRLSTILASAILCVAEPHAAIAQTIDVLPIGPAAGSATAVAPGDTTKTFFVRRDLVWSGAALAGSAVLSIFDKRIEHYIQTPSIQGSSSRARVVGDLTHVNETTLTEAAVLSYGIGRLVKSNTMADVSLHTAESVVLTSVVSQIIRGPLGRARPDVTPDDQYHFQFGKGFTHFDNRAFPSLHSATAFAAAAALVGEIHERDPGASWFAAPLLYAAAAVPGLTRMYLNEHWASDVVAGAFVGTLLGSRVVHYAHTHKRNKLDRFLLGASAAPDGHGGATVGFTLIR